MNRILLGIVVLALSGGLVHADVLLAQSPTGNSNNPYNSPIRRANPNSMQGTQPSAPPFGGRTPYQRRASLRSRTGALATASRSVRCRALPPRSFPTHLRAAETAIVERQD